MTKFLLSHFWISFILSAIILFIAMKIKKSGISYNVMHASANKTSLILRFSLLDLAYGILIFIPLILGSVLYDSIAEPIKINSARAAMVSIQDKLEQYWDAGDDPERSETTSQEIPTEQGRGASSDAGNDDVPKVLIISKNDNIEDTCHIDDLQFKLPGDMIPKTEADVNYIAKINWYFMNYGSYSNGDTASSTCAHITILDASNNEIISENDIYGDEPNVTRRVGASGSVIGPIPAEKIIHYIRQTILMLLFKTN